MCGRYTLTHEEDGIRKRFYVPDTFRETRLVPSFNIAPTHEVAVVLSDKDSRALERFKWGLIPSWVKDLKKMRPMTNARLETIAEKPFFKSALAKRRCLIPADGFYEWKAEEGNKIKTPMWIYLPGRPLFAFAGLWDEWKDADGKPVRTCTIVTMPANNVMQPVHERMPAILSVDNEARWLDESVKDPAELIGMLQSCQTTNFEMHAVSTRVNSPKSNVPDLISPAAV